LNSRRGEAFDPLGIGTVSHCTAGELLAKKSRRSRDLDDFFAELSNDELSLSWDDDI
jgi:hypothetical protein